MRVCLVSSEVMPFTGGGLATYAVEMARALTSRGHEVHLLTQAFEGLQERGAGHLPGVVLHSYDVNEGQAGLPGAFFTHASRASYAIWLALRRLHASHGFSYIEFPEYRGEGYWSLRARRTLGAFSGAVLGVRLHTPHHLAMDVDRIFTMPLEHAHTRHMERWSILEADVVVGASEAVLGHAREDVSRIPPVPPGPTYHLLRLPLEAVTKAAEESRAERVESASGSGEAEILYFGRLQQCKGVPTLVAAALRLMQRGVACRVRLIGGDTHSGPFGRSMREHLERMIAGPHQERFVFEPPRSREALREAIDRATVCCFPSLWESYAYACVEALSQGACVVASSAGSLPEIVEHEQSGLIFKAEDAADLERVLRRAVEDWALRGRLKAAAPARARALSEPEAIARGLEGVIAGAEQRRRNAAESGLDGAREAGREPGRASVTVAIPFYNMGRYLPETLASLQRQTRRDFELLIVDDGSTEEASLKLLDELREGGVRVVRKPNGGLGSARNTALREARTPWVIFIDPDDVAHEEFVERLCGAVERDPGLTFAACMFESFHERPGEAVSGYAPLAADRDLLVFHNIAGPGSASIIRREAALAAGGCDEWLTSFEDWDLWCTLAAKGHRGTVIPEFLLYYRLRPNSLLRGEGIPRMHALRAYLLKKHAGLAWEGDVPSRMLLAEAFEQKARADALEAQLHALRAQAHASAGGGAGAEAIHVEVKRVIDLNLRYRLADKVNGMLKAVGVQRLVKAAFQPREPK